MSSQSPISSGKFSLGTVVATPGVLQAVPRRDLVSALDRHVRGDWGEVDAHDRRENELSLTAGLRLFSVYRATGGEVFWVITEADRSSTTVLLPDEY